MNTLDHRSDFITAYIFRHKTYSNIIFHKDVKTGENLKLPIKRFGSANIANALKKATNIIKNIRNKESSCFAIVSDGIGIFPIMPEIIKFRNALLGIRARGCRTCVRCFFIKKKNNTKIPTKYERFCKRLDSNVQIIEVGPLREP